MGLFDKIKNTTAEIFMKKGYEDKKNGYMLLAYNNFAKAVKFGEVRGYFELGLINYEEEHYKMAKENFENVVDNIIESKYYLGLIYMLDNNVISKDVNEAMCPEYDKAFNCFTKSMESKDKNIHIQSEIQLANCYFNGYGTQENKKKAFEILNKYESINEAQTLLAYYYEEGLYVEKDIKKATEMYLNNIDSLENKYKLGKMFLTGENIDVERAYILLKQIPNYKDTNDYLIGLDKIIKETYTLEYRLNYLYKIIESSLSEKEKEIFTKLKEKNNEIEWQSLMRQYAYGNGEIAPSFYKSMVLAYYVISLDYDLNTQVFEPINFISEKYESEYNKIIEAIRKEEYSYEDICNLKKISDEGNLLAYYEYERIAERLNKVPSDTIENPYKPSYDVNDSPLILMLLALNENTKALWTLRWLYGTNFTNKQVYTYNSFLSDVFGYWAIYFSESRSRDGSIDDLVSLLEWYNDDTNNSFYSYSKAQNIANKIMNSKSIYGKCLLASLDATDQMADYIYGLTIIQFDKQEIKKYADAAIKYDYKIGEDTLGSYKALLVKEQREDEFERALKAYQQEKINKEVELRMKDVRKKIDDFEIFLNGREHGEYRTNDDYYFRKKILDGSIEAAQNYVNQSIIRQRIEDYYKDKIKKEINN